MNRELFNDKELLELYKKYNGNIDKIMRETGYTQAYIDVRLKRIMPKEVNPVDVVNMWLDGWTKTDICNKLTIPMKKVTEILRNANLLTEEKPMGEQIRYAEPIDRTPKKVVINGKRYLSFTPNQFDYCAVSDMEIRED